MSRKDLKIPPIINSFKEIYYFLRTLLFLLNKLLQMKGYRLLSSNFSATSLRSIFSFLACIKHAKNFAPYNFFIPYDARKVIDKINTFLKAILWLLSLLYMWKQQHLILLGRFIFPFQMCVRMKIALNLYSPLNTLFIWPLLVTTTTTSSATCYSTLHFSVRCLKLHEM